MDLVSLVVAPGLFDSAPVRTAALVGGAAALVSGVTGVFTVIRGQSFAGHALADLSGAGGAAALLVGANPLVGFLGMGVLAAAGMDAFRVERASERDLVTGVVTGAGLGLAALLLYLDVTHGHVAGAAATIMFGSMFTISPSLVPLAGAAALVALATLTALYRPLLLIALDADLAAAQGVRVRLVGFAQLAATALSVALSAMAVGAILSTALLIGPAATALRLARAPARAIALAAGLGVAATWGGILVAYDSYGWTGGRPWPVSVCVVALVGLEYALAALARR